MAAPMRRFLCSAAVVFMWFALPCFTLQQDQNVESFFKSGHTNNWAVLVCTSRFWFNYRHVANTLSIYRSVKRLGIPDSQIILMLADDMACNARNPRPATVFNNANQHINVYGDDVEVDYRGYEVTVENFIRVLTGRLPPGTPRSKRLMTDDRSNILVYMTGHGGDGFLKFQDAEEISNVELAHAFQQMWQKKRYHEVLYIIDTCQAVSMYQLFYSPNILAVGSSQVGEDSLSHHVDPAIGVYIIDRYTYYALEFLEKITPTSKKTMADFFQVCPQHVCRSTPGVRTDLFRRDVAKVPITDFFGSVRNVELSLTTVPLSNETESTEGGAQVQKQGEEEGRKEQPKRYGFVDQFPAMAETREKETSVSKVKFSSQFLVASSAFLALVAIIIFGRIAS
ncbi:putative GPI-anchor transamidase [Patiria miniata]|uniref:GPI-anchor transamidase n=1 Tax=Patiria miniata TaxID=46514 RepID=A0A913Z2Z5_PATMI|nr:putative GPI-anchor transamidase [Patiria miniata]